MSLVSKCIHALNFTSTEMACVVFVEASRLRLRELQDRAIRFLLEDRNFFYKEDSNISLETINTQAVQALTRIDSLAPGYFRIRNLRILSLNGEDTISTLLGKVNALVELCIEGRVGPNEANALLDAAKNGDLKHLRTLEIGTLEGCTEIFIQLKPFLPDLAHFETYNPYPELLEAFGSIYRTKPHDHFYGGW